MFLEAARQFCLCDLSIIIDKRANERRRRRPRYKQAGAGAGVRLIELGGVPTVEQAKLTRKERRWLVNRIGFLDRVNRGTVSSEESRYILPELREVMGGRG